MDDETTARKSGWLASNVAERTATDGADLDNGPRAVTRSVALAAALVVLGTIALVLPWPIQRPIWIKAEIVFATWWVVWTLVLTVMLYHGVSPRRQPTYAADGSSGHGSWGWIDGLGSVGELGDTAGGAHLIAALVALVALVLVIWLVVEVIAPLVVPVGYAVVWWILARVLRSSERCRGNALQSLARGVLWASALTLPLAIGVALLHGLI
jgi:hypothetical protein